MDDRLGIVLLLGLMTALVTCAGCLDDPGPLPWEDTAGWMVDAD